MARFQHGRPPADSRVSNPLRAKILRARNAPWVPATTLNAPEVVYAFVLAPAVSVQATGPSAEVKNPPYLLSHYDFPSPVRERKRQPRLKFSGSSPLRKVRIKRPDSHPRPYARSTVSSGASPKTAQVECGIQMRWLALTGAATYHSGVSVLDCVQAVTGGALWLLELRA